MLVLLLACTPEVPSVEDAETEWITEIEVTTGALIPAALEVTFTSAEDAVGWVEFGVGSTDTFTTPLTTSGTAHTAAVIGNPALTEVSMRVVIEVDGTRHESGTFTAETGQHLPETPIMEVTVNNYDAPAGTSLLMSVFGMVNYLVMMDLDGTTTWSLAQGAEDEYGGLGVVPVDDGLMYNRLEIGDGDDASIEHVDFLGNPISSFNNPSAHHFFTIGPQEELVWLEEDVRFQGNTEVIGDVVMRRDTAGKEDVLFSHWDSFTNPQDTEQQYLDWTHGNWIDWDAERGSYLLSNAFTNTIAELDADGVPLRIIGGPGAVDSEYIFGSFEEAFEYPHGPHWADNGELLVFSTVDKVSRVVRYEVDDQYKQIHEVWSYGADYEYEALWLGEIQELPDGNLLISWGSVGLLQIVSPDGELLWEAAAPFQSFFNQTHPMSDPYTLWE